MKLFALLVVALPAASQTPAALLAQLDRVRWEEPYRPARSCTNHIPAQMETTALSVWTHMNEDDAVFYFGEIDRVLQAGGKAIVTFYLLDDLYHSSVNTWSEQMGRYNNSYQNSRIFNTPSSQSRNWFHPDWAAQPEETIGVTPAGIQTMLDATRLSLVETYVGNWKEVPGVFYQDILVFEST